MATSRLAAVQRAPCALRTQRAAVSLPRSARLRTLVRAEAQTKAPASVAKVGSASLQGTSRKQNEDRLSVLSSDTSPPGEPVAYAAVFDGHGGYAAAEWLQKNFLQYLEQYWKSGNAAEASVSKAFIEADKALLKPQGGFLGLGERGVGGSKCGASAAMAIVFKDASGATKLLTANAGDARIVLVRGGQTVQLTEDHVPDNEKERKRIERENPNPRMPLVRYVGGTWRVGGLLALSRAFGDAYMKGSLQFEGVAAGGDGYSSGFGVVATPYTTLDDLTTDDTYLVVASDGLYANVERGGGGGLSNDEVGEMCTKLGAGGDLDAVAKALATAAVKAGSTDDVTVVVLKMA